MIERGAPHEHGGDILRPDGTPPRPPLADADARQPHTQRCARIAGAFRPDTMALEVDDCAVQGAGSQLGWLLGPAHSPAPPAHGPSAPLGTRARA